MSQQINLLNRALIKQKDLLNTNTIAITLGLLMVLMFGYYAFSQKQLSLVTIQRSQVAEELSAMQAQLTQSALLHAPRELDKALQGQITQLELKEAMQQQVLQTVSLSSAAPDKGYAALMRAFAKQTLEGLWLTGFNIDSHTQQLNINGRTLEANLVPEYLSRLSHEPALQGKQFSGLNMSQSKAEDISNKEATPVVTKTELPYIEFKLQSIITELDAHVPATENANSGGKS